MKKKETSKFWAFIPVHKFVSFIASVISVVVAVFSVLIDYKDVQAEKPTSQVIYIVLGFILLLGVFTALLMGVQRGSSKVVRLKERLQKSFLKALDDSPLNPNRSERGQNA